MEYNKPQQDLSSIKALKVLGRGATGTVFLAYDSSANNKNKSLFALKVTDKHSSTPSTLRRALHETTLLSSLSISPHPFLPSLLSTFSSPSLLAFSLPFSSGGDLHSLLRLHPDRSLSPSSILFYLSQILSALHHLHSHSIVYRDLKPENILIQSSGHLTLTDFDLSRRLNHLSPDNNNNNLSSKQTSIALFKKTKSARVSPTISRERSNSFVGTEEYVSPEVVRGDGHEFAVDWWAMGVLAYEMLYGTTPFRGKNRNETFRNVLFKEPEIVGKRTPLTDLIGRLLAKDPVKRLGYYGGAEEIKGDPFFKGVRWDLITEVLRPPFVPSVDEEGLETAMVNGEGFGVTEYFDRLRAPSPVGEDPLRLNSFAEF